MNFILLLLSVKIVSSRLLGYNMAKNNIAIHSFETTFCNGDYMCPQNSDCEYYNQTIGYCACDKDYYSLDGFCDHKRKSALVGLLLTIFLQEIAPIGRMYALGGLKTNDGTEGVIIFELFTCGLLGLVISTCCFMVLLFLTYCIGSCLGLSDKLRDDFMGIVTVIGVVFLSIIVFLTIMWWIIDVIGFANNIYPDENGHTLIPIG